MIVKFKGKVAKSGERLIIIIPKKIHPMIQHRKWYLIIMEQVE